MEYIEREALEWSLDAAIMAFLEKEDHLFDEKSVLAGISVAAGIVHVVPAADVAPVVHGQWLDVGSLSCRRSNCGCKNGKETNYCPNCGAKLDLPPSNLRKEDCP